jgi:CheY-like chemotaxis protein
MSFDALPILLAEDNEDDVFILRRALRQAEVKNPVQVAGDGQELADYLAGEGAFADRQKHPLPFLLLLDLKIPLQSGLEVLAWMRQQPNLQRIVVVVLTSSAEPRDLKTARELGARFYLVKPPKAETLSAIMAVLRAEWNGESASGVTRVEGDLFDIVTATEKK